jgi:soluble lytic murein transglycosylase
MFKIIKILNNKGFDLVMHRIKIIILTAAIALLASSCGSIGLIRERTPETAPETVAEQQPPEPEVLAEEPEPAEVVLDQEEKIPFPKNLEESRSYFVKGASLFEDGKYEESQYYLNRVLNSYPILKDYVIYYLAKISMQEEDFESAAKHYDRLIEDHSGSIWYEKSNLEVADLYYLGGDYEKALDYYESFMKRFPASPDIPYVLTQHGQCLEKNGELESAQKTYLDIYLNHPSSSLSSRALTGLRNIAEKKGEEFMLSGEEIFQRGYNLFKAFDYNGALDEFDKILKSDIYEQASTDLKSRTVFRAGMAYYNLREYSTARDYLKRSYDEFPGARLAPDSLYFLGRALTNTGESETAVDTYLKLVERYPASNLADDALYRIGRIYFTQQDMEKAMEYLHLAVERYPQSDIISDIYWELGWMQYSLGRYGDSLKTFDLMSSSFRGSQLAEISLFWKAKSQQKLGMDGETITTYKAVANLNPYSYYGFRSVEILKELGVSVDFPVFDRDLSPTNPEIAKLLPQIYDFADVKNGSHSLQSNKHVSKAKELLFLGLEPLAAKEISAAEDEIEKDPTTILELSTFYLNAKDYANSIAIVRRNYSRLLSSLSGPERDYFFYLAYPFAYGDYVSSFSETHGVDPLFVLSIIREESNFRYDAKSHAGALGLMQVMPGTGSDIASQMGYEGFKPDMLLDSEVSVKMGSFYIRKMLDMFDGNIFYALGAYNGGPGSMQSWIKRFGDLDIDEFIECVTFDETRTYIKRVTGTYNIYKMLYGGQALI